MPATSTLFRAARPTFRSSNFFTQGSAFRSTRTRFGGGRWTSTAAPEVKGTQQSFARKMWDSPIGVKTVHFWAPVMKWALVLAGVSDFYRPAENLSLTQNAALTCTGMIWTRWCLIIKPRNILLASVNFLLAVVGVTQVYRIMAYNASVKKQSPTAKLEDATDSAIDSAKGIKKDVVAAVKK